MGRNSNKGGLFLNARRKKKIVNNGLIKWRQQQRMRKDDSHEENPPFSEYQPDMTPEMYDQRKKEFLESLSRSENERKEIERATSLQAGSGLWKEERRKLLTTSNFGTVCKRRNTTSCEKLVKTLLYTDVENTAMRYGKDNEINAISQLEESLNVRVRQCGLFIDKDIPFLGASPDGLVGTDCTVEVKCPESCKNLTPDEAVRSGKFTFLNASENVNKNHNFYFQIQGQLHITQRAKCYFVLWTPLGFRIETIVRDDDFWSNHMVENLKRFYINCLLPELVDPRHTRSMEIRNPEYILKAIQVQKSKKAKMIKPSVQTA